MSIQKPYNANIKNAVIDRNSDYLLKWQTSGDTSASYAINIYNLEDDNLVWSVPRTYSFALSHTIPANSLLVGSEYKINITVWNSSNQSATSNFVMFTAMTRPVVSVTPIDVVSNHSYLFTAEYSQVESVPLSTYVVNLYDAEQKLIKTSGILTDGYLEYRFELLKNETSYFVEFVATAKLGLTVTSGLIPFTVVYENPLIYFELSAEQMPEIASVKLNWKIRQVIGKTNIEPKYIGGGNKLDVREGKVFFDEGFEIERDFTLRLWFEHIVRDVDVIYLKGVNGNIRVQYKSDNRIHLYKQVGNFSYHYTTNEILSDGIFLCIEQKDGRMDMYTEQIPASIIIGLNGMTFDQLKDTTFSQLTDATFS